MRRQGGWSERSSGSAWVAGVGLTAMVAMLGSGPSPDAIPDLRGPPWPSHVKALFSVLTEVDTFAVWTRLANYLGERAHAA